MEKILIGILLLLTINPVLRYFLFVVLYFWGLYVFKYITTQGKENIPNKMMHCLIISNHCTFFDSWLIRIRLINVWTLFFFQKMIPYDAPDKKNFYSNWIKAYFMYLLKNVKVNRGKMNTVLASKIINSYCEILRNGQGLIQNLIRKRGNLILFPEGGRTKEGKKAMDVFKKGIAMTMLKMTIYNNHFQILPIYLDNIQEMLPPELGQKYFRTKRKIKGQIIIGKPFSVLDICVRKDIQEEDKILLIIERGRNAILSLKP